MIIEITGVTSGQSPYDIFLCSTGGTSCFFISGNTFIPPNIVIDSEDYFPGEQTLLVRLIDTNGCVHEKIEDCSSGTTGTCICNEYKIIWGHPGIISFSYNPYCVSGTSIIQTISYPTPFTFSSSTSPMVIAGFSGLIHKTNNTYPCLTPVYDFVTTWTIPEDIVPITLPLISSGNYDFIVDWGDGNSDSINTWNDPQKTHTYSLPGNYTVTISGTIEGWSFNSSFSTSYITSVVSWGPLRLGNNGYNFASCDLLDLSTTLDVLNLSGVTNLNYCFYRCENITTINNVELWDTSMVETFEWTFGYCYTFDDDLSDWVMSSATNTSGMFLRSLLFNNGGSPLIDNWDVSNVTDMSNMFLIAPSFDQPIGSWDVQNVSDMSDMFGSSTLSTTNYDILLNGWSTLPSLQPNVVFDGGNSQYTITTAGAARSILTNTPNNWTITDGGGI
jgi:hypothetical protein